MARLRRATVIETGLFEIQAQHLHDCRERCRTVPDSRDVIQAMLQQGASNYAVDRLIRYEATVWRQVARTLYALEILWIVVNPRSDPRVFGRINEARGWCKTSVVVAGNAAALIRGR